MRYHFPAPSRVSASDSTPTSRAIIPELDSEGVAYSVKLTVRAADSHIERRIGREIVNAINLRADTLATLRAARALLDSVAFVATEGDSVAMIARIDALMADYRYGYGPEKPAEPKL